MSSTSIPTLTELIERESERDSAERWELEDSRMLNVNLDGDVFIKKGTMIAHIGAMEFKRASTGSLSRFLKSAIEGVSLVKVTGQGKLFVAEGGKHIQLMRLGESETLFVDGRDLLAFDSTVQWEITTIRSAGFMSGAGLFAVHLTGPGVVAITSHGSPLALRLKPGQPVFTDPNATVAWSGHVKPELQVSVGLKDLVGTGGGEALQLRFEGEGFVIVQPYEEVATTSA